MLVASWVAVVILAACYRPRGSAAIAATFDRWRDADAAAVSMTLYTRSSSSDRDVVIWDKLNCSLIIAPLVLWQLLKLMRWKLTQRSPADNRDYTTHKSSTCTSRTHMSLYEACAITCTSWIDGNSTYLAVKLPMLIMTLLSLTSLISQRNLYHIVLHCSCLFLRERLTKWFTEFIVIRFPFLRVTDICECDRQTDRVRCMMWKVQRDW